MSNTNIMEGVRQFLRTYPPLAEGKLHVDFLPEEAKSYSIEAIPAKEIVRSYVDGSAVKQFLFVVASREFYGKDVNQQLDNLEFYTDFSAWLREQTMRKNLPELGWNKNALSMEVSTSGYAMSMDEDEARYQIQCRLEYFEHR